MTDFRRLEETLEIPGVKIEKYRFVQKRMVSQGIASPDAADNYLAETTNIFQLCITLKNGSVKLEPGALQYMRGNIEATIHKHEDRNFLSRSIASAGTGEAAHATEYKGSGVIWTEPSRKHYILGEMSGDEDSLMLDDKAFFACSSGISLSTHKHNSLSGMLSGNGFVQPKISGNGIFAIESPVPVEELDQIELANGEEVTVDGDFMLMYSASLNVSIGSLVKGLRNTMRSGEGVVFKLKGKGSVWVMPTAKTNHF